MNRFDVLIIGSGAGGAAAAWRYASHGLSVCVVEQGSWMESHNSPVRRPYGEIERFGKLSPLPGIRKDPWDTPIDVVNSEIELSFLQAVGGSTVIYSGHFPRFRSMDFQMKTEWGLADDWPISYEEMIPYYELNEERMCVSGVVGDPRFPEIRSLGEPAPIGNAGAKLTKVFEDLNWHIWPSYGAFKVGSKYQHQCLKLGSCNLGCPNDAKGTAVNGYLSEAISLGVKILPETSALRILNEQGKAYGAEVTDRLGNITQIKARWTVLAGGTVGTTKLLLNALRNDPEIGEKRGVELIGKNLMLHPLGVVEGVFEEDMDFDSGPEGSWLYSLEFDFDRRSSTPGFMMQMLRSVHPSSEAVRQMQLGRIRFGKSFSTTALGDLKKTMSIALVAEDLPEVHNELTLDYSKTNLYGSEGLSVHYRCSEDVKKNLTMGLTKARQALLEMGAKKVRGISPVRGSGWHPSGTARFSRDPMKSACDENGQFRGLENLFVSDASLFPTGSCLNPTNTIQSLSLLLADRIVDQYA